MGECHIQCRADQAQFQHVEAALSRLVLADEGLGATETSSQFALTQTGIESDLAQEAEQLVALGS